MAEGIAPWIVAADPASHFIRAYQISGQLAAERARLQQQVQEQAMAMQVKQQQMQQDALENQQKLAMAKAYQEAQTGLRAQQLQAAQERVKQDAQIALQRYQISERNRLLREAASAQEKGLDRESRERIAQAALGGRMDVAKMREDAIAKRGANPTVTSQANLLGKIPELAAISPGVTNMIPTLTGNLSKAMGVPPMAPAPAPAQAPAPQGGWWSRMFGGGGGSVPTPPEGRMPLAQAAQAPAGPKILPYPKSKDEAVKGELYQTRYGPRMWNGEHMVLPQAAAASPAAKAAASGGPPPDDDEEP